MVDHAQSWQSIPAGVVARAAQVAAHVSKEIGTDVPPHEAPLPVAALEAIVIPTAHDWLPVLDGPVARWLIGNHVGRRRRHGRDYMRAPPTGRVGRPREECAHEGPVTDAGR